jgi:hypothetical protein
MLVLARLPRFPHRGLGFGVRHSHLPFVWLVVVVLIVVIVLLAVRRR